jgi:hypothetical protein
VQDKP